MHTLIIKPSALEVVKTIGFRFAKPKEKPPTVKVIFSRTFQRQILE